MLVSQGVERILLCYYFIDEKQSLLLGLTQYSLDLVQSTCLMVVIGGFREADTDRFFS